MIRKFILLVVVLFLIVAGWVYLDISQNKKIIKITSSPEQYLDIGVSKVLWKLENEEDLNNEDLSIIDNTLDFIENRYNTSDSRIQSLLRIMYEYSDILPAVTVSSVKETLLGFKYWMNEPGEDSMYFWSESNQILFASAEYIVGHMYPSEEFTNDGKTGEEHKEIARKRILSWLEQRWLYGFTEWYSDKNYVENIAALSNLIDFSEDEEIIIKSKIILDLLLYDVASQSYKGSFVSTSGKMYDSSKKSGTNSLIRTINQHIWGYELGEDRKGIDSNFIFVNNYEVPDVIKLIGSDSSEVVVKASNGLNITELKTEGLMGIEDEQIMMQWAMESFTNSEVISNTIRYIDKFNMFSNEFLHDLKYMNIGFLKNFGLLTMASKILNPKTNGQAIQRANTYTFKNDYFSLSTTQNYHPGEFGNQHYIWSATLSNDLSIFTSHPAKPLPNIDELSDYSEYSVELGILPHSIQEENMNLSIYVVPNKQIFDFKKDELVDYTYAYFPQSKFDETVIEGKYAFGRLGDIYITLIGKNDLNYQLNSDENLIQKGKKTYWITELSSIEDESFENFMTRIKNNEVVFNEKSITLTYNSYKKLDLTYRGYFKVNDAIMNTEYKRFNSPYVKADRKPNTVTIEYNGKRLHLDFYNKKREIE